MTPATTRPALRTLAAGLLAIVATAACAVGDPMPAGPETLAIPVFSHGASHADGPKGTHMIGANETPPRETAAQGQLILRFEAGGTELRYKLLAANIVDVTQAHIHLAPPGVPGPAVVWLYPSAPPAVPIPGRFQGVLAEGVITDASVVGPLAGEGVAGLVAAIREGNAYANVHTVQYPPGEIRGQVE
jgi:hypothetical protein